MANRTCRPSWVPQAVPLRRQSLPVSKPLIGLQSPGLGYLKPFMIMVLLLRPLWKQTSAADADWAARTKPRTTGIIFNVERIIHSFLLPLPRGALRRHVSPHAVEECRGHAGLPRAGPQAERRNLGAFRSRSR